MFSLEPDDAQMRVLLDAAFERIRSHLSTLADAHPRIDEGGAELAARLRALRFPEQGASIDDVLGTIFDDGLSVTFNTASPGYLAYVPGGGIFSSALADFIAASINRYVGVWLAAPGLVQLEQNVIRFLCELVGYGADAGGYLATGGSLANLSAVVTARSEKLGERFDDGVLYCSREAHHSIDKAALIAGLPRAHLRHVDVDENFRIDVEALARAIHDDRAAGRRPFCIVANAGSTNTGAVDDLPAIAALAAREGLWFHVDAAYGGAFLLTERGARALVGIERADSVTLDPHKGFFLPYGTGCLLVRDTRALRRAHEVTGAYMPPMQEHPEHIDFCALSPELSRGFRGLSLWLPLMLHGVAAFRSALDEKLDLARHLAAALCERERVELAAPPTLSLLAFRVRPPHDASSPMEDDDVDAYNRQLMERINQRGNVYLTGTVSGGRFLIRACILHFRTHAERIALLIEDFDAARAALDAEWRAQGERSA